MGVFCVDYYELPDEGKVTAFDLGVCRLPKNITKTNISLKYMNFAMIPFYWVISSLI